MNKLLVLRQKMKECVLDAIIVNDELNQRYLSDFAFSDGLLLITEYKAYLITDFRYYEMAINKADKAFEVVMPDNRVQFIAKALSDCDCRKVGFEGDAVSYSVYQSYTESYPQIAFQSINGMLEKLRRVKSPEEIQKMQKAQDITDKAFSHILSIIKPEMTELDVAVELEYAMRKLGAEAISFDTVAVSGDASALPHGTPRNLKLRRGFLTMDFGAKLDGYCSDMTRTVVIGKADGDMKKLYNTVLRAQLAALDFLKEGVDCGEADKVARDIIDSIPEFKGTFGHSLGHSIGLFVHEAPGLSKRSFGTKLMAGQVTSVEPGIYLFGKYGCRIEDLVAIEKNGICNLTHSTKELIEIF